MKNKILIFIMVILIVILGVVVYINCKKTYRANVDDSYSLILEKIGIQKGYEEIKTEVNQTVEDNGIRITLMDCGYDSSRFILCYKVEDLEGKIKAINDEYQSKLEEGVNGTIYDSMYLEGYSKFYTENETVENPDADMGKDIILLSNKISDTDFIVYQEIIISEYIWNGTISKVDIKLECLNFLGENKSIEGNWQFFIEQLNDKYKEGNYCKLNVSKQIDDNLYIESIVVNNLGMFGTLGQIQFSYDESRNEENNGDYLIRVVDENNDIIGEFDLPIGQIKTGESPIVYKYMSELKNNKDYKILIYNNENYDDIESGKEEPISTIDFMYNEN